MSIATMRLLAVAVGVLIGISDGRSADIGFWIAAGTLSIHASFRLFAPDKSDSGFRAEFPVLVELLLVAVCLAISGGWAGPFALAPVAVCLTAGYRWGYLQGSFAAMSIVLIVAGYDLSVRSVVDTVRPAINGTAYSWVSALFGAFIATALVEAATKARSSRDDVSQMATANELLLALHDVAQNLPSSLDLGEVMSSARDKFRQLFDFQSVTVLVRDEALNNWHTVLADGTRTPPAVSQADLPSSLRGTLDLSTTRAILNLVDSGLVGCSGLSKSALQTTLISRGKTVGLVSIEHTKPNAFVEHDVQLLASVAPAIALAIDNANWFGRIRSLGAEAERNRIARDLHDRLAQSLAYIAFELERIEAASSGNIELGHLRNVVREVLGDLRETLYELRANVSEDSDFATVAADYLKRFQQRSGIVAEFEAKSANVRLPIQVEQELWRILQEALTNVERHAEASGVFVRWGVEHGQAWLEVRDDGKGFRPNQVRRERFGLVGMRERADAIGARLRIDSSPGQGTRILATLEVPT